MGPIALVNTNEIKPPVAPVGLDYLGGALARVDHRVEVMDLNFADDPTARLRKELGGMEPRLVGVSFRNSDDCFWPSAASFVPRLGELIEVIRGAAAAPLLLGGSGFSVFPGAILRLTGADFGICGGGERACVQLLDALDGRGDLGDVPGLVWRRGDALRRNRICSPPSLRLPTGRNLIRNRRYFRDGGQLGLETKRGCNRRCTYCADPLIKGGRISTRPPAEVADEAEGLARRGIDVLHVCDSEFNIPIDHALAVCREFRRRGLGEKLRWYAYVSPLPFTRELAGAMRDAGCVGVDFGADSASPAMLATYGRSHRREDIATAVKACREAGIKVMIDLLLGGPGETEGTVRETIEFTRRLDPHCVGAALGVRLYPGAPLTRRLSREGPLRDNPGVRWSEDPRLPRRLSDNTADELLRPAFYISHRLGEEPARLVGDVIGDDKRFFRPITQQSAENYNYNQNRPLQEAIRDGARGAYWDILREMK